MFQKNHLYYALPAILLSTLLVAVVIYAWVPPVAAPPGGNVPAPINVGGIAQSKGGSLTIGTTGGLFETYHQTLLATVDGNVGIKKTNPTAPLHIGASDPVQELRFLTGIDSFPTEHVPYIATVGPNLTGKGRGSLIISPLNADQTSSEILFMTGGLPTMVIHRGVGVGIGLSIHESPTKRLDVRGDTYISGDVSIGPLAHTRTGKLTVDGNVTPSGANTGQVGTDTHYWNQMNAGAYYYRSDINLKENIKPLNNTLEKVLQLRGVSFQWKDTREDSIGLIAQEVEEFFPEFIFTNKETGVKTLDYAKLIVPLIEAIKEQQKEIEELKAIIQ